MAAKQNYVALAGIGVVAAATGAGVYFYLQARAPQPAPQAAGAGRGQVAAKTPAFWTARVTTLAGDGLAGAVEGNMPLTVARFADPYGVAVDAAGNIYIADAGDNNRIRKLTPGGATSTLAGGKEGFVDGPGAQARFNTPSGIAIDAQGNLYVADTGNNAIRKVAPDGTVSTLAGNGAAGTADGKGKDAQFNGPVGVAVGDDGVVYVADTYNDAIRRIAPDGAVTTIAGSGAPGDADGPALNAGFDTPCALVLDGDGGLLIADTRNNAIRKLGKDGMVSTVMRAPENNRQAVLRRPMALARTADGHLYIASGSQGRILQLTPQGELGGLLDIGQRVEPEYGSDGKVQLYAPRGMALARNGSLVVSDAATFRIHRLSAATSADALPAPPQPAAAAAGNSGSSGGAPQSAALAALPMGAAQAEGKGTDAGSGSGASLPRESAPARRAAPVTTMLWPVGPQDQPHEIVGVMGEVRGNFEGESRDHFHAGLDVQADVGKPVLAVAPVKVSDPLPNWGFGSLSEGIALGNISYIHMRVGRDPKNAPLDQRFQLLLNAKGKPERVRVRRGARFAAGDMLGTINGMAHVHLDYYDQGKALNPLSLPFKGQLDTVRPRINSITLFDSRGKLIKAAKRKPLIVQRSAGELSIVVDAYDQMDGNEARRRLGLYTLGYQLLREDGSPVAGYEQPLITQVYDELPRNCEAVKYAYAPNSGITVYGSKATRFAYMLTNRMVHGQVTPGMWNVAGLAPGNYRLRVLAADYAGNKAVDGRDLPFTLE
ncbi:NHL repeat-containing protein [Massilia sp. Root351]|uniref:NHL repeat-containing protein n=1 Tax=Massilia sp. Root351 TaxID=1736522 RepID=UPI001E332F15|nr:NHL repeat-containing protein [Massilia sp. Root351]